MPATAPIHVEFADELLKAIQHYGLISTKAKAAATVSYGNHQTVIIVKAANGQEVGITIEKVK